MEGMTILSMECLKYTGEKESYDPKKRIESDLSLHVFCNHNVMNEGVLKREAHATAFH